MVNSTGGYQHSEPVGPPNSQLSQMRNAKGIRSSTATQQTNRKTSSFIGRLRTGLGLNPLNTKLRGYLPTTKEFRDRKIRGETLNFPNEYTPAPSPEGQYTPAPSHYSPAPDNSGGYDATPPPALKALLDAQSGRYPPPSSPARSPATSEYGPVSSLGSDYLNTSKLNGSSVNGSAETRITYEQMPPAPAPPPPNDEDNAFSAPGFGQYSTVGSTTNKGNSGRADGDTSRSERADDASDEVSFTLPGFVNNGTEAQQADSADDSTSHFVQNLVSRAKIFVSRFGRKHAVKSDDGSKSKIDPLSDEATAERQLSYNGKNFTDGPAFQRPAVHQGSNNNDDVTNSNQAADGGTHGASTTSAEDKTPESLGPGNRPEPPPYGSMPKEGEQLPNPRANSGSAQTNNGPRDHYGPMPGK